MAAFTSLAWLSALRERDPTRAAAMGLQMDKSSTASRGSGRRKTFTTEVTRRLAKLIDRRKHDIDLRNVEFERGYGEQCSDADALRSFMRDEHRRRLIAEGMAAVDAERRVKEQAQRLNLRSD